MGGKKQKWNKINMWVIFGIFGKAVKNMNLLKYINKILIGIVFFLLVQLLWQGVRHQEIWRAHTETQRAKRGKLSLSTFPSPLATLIPPGCLFVCLFFLFPNITINNNKTYKKKEQSVIRGGHQEKVNAYTETGPFMI